MRKVILHMMLTLEGCVSGPNGELDWLFAIQDDEREKYIFDLYSKMDGALVGCETYQGMAGYWPSAASDASGKERDRKFARRMNEMTKFVFSKTLEKVEWTNSRLVNGDVAEEVAKLKQQPGKDLVLCGGFRLAQTFVKLGLIDEYHLIVHPVVLGSGKRLFDIEGLKDGLNLKLESEKAFNSGVIALHYNKA
jgi:dihydrofolate reductase